MNDKKENKNCMEYESKVKLWKKAYQEIEDACQKYVDFKEFGFHDISSMLNSARDHLTLIDWYEKYGLKIDHSNRPYTNKSCTIGEYIKIYYFKNAKDCKKEKRGMYISWSDDGTQPEDGWVLSLRFPTGAYIFGGDYEGQQQLFQDFFNELKTYQPDHSDTVNKGLYWRIENSKAIMENFQAILQKYIERNKSEMKTRKADSLRAQLAQLEQEAKKEVEE